MLGSSHDTMQHTRHTSQITMLEDSECQQVSEVMPQADYCFVLGKAQATKWQ